MVRLIVILIAILISFSNAHSQEIKANVTVNVDQLAFESRNYVASLERDLETYINNTVFYSSEWEGDPIPVEIQIALSGGTNQRYSAQLFIISRRYLDGTSEQPGESVAAKYYDNKWNFEYGMGASLNFNPLVYNEFNTLIDYYMLLVIGHDLDSYEELGGTPLFEKAKNILMLGAANNGQGYETSSQPGEFTRYNLVSELTDVRYDSFRKSVYKYYVTGLDKMEFNRDEAIAAIKGVIDELATFKEKKLVGPSVLMQAFFDTKALELGSVFNGYEDKTVFSTLRYLDPTNATIYEQAKSGELR